MCRSKRVTSLSLLSVALSVGCGGSTRSTPDEPRQATATAGAFATNGASATSGTGGASSDSRPPGGGGAGGGSGGTEPLGTAGYYAGTDFGRTNNEGWLCSSPQTEPSLGLIRCAEGYLHRPTAVACGDDDERAAAQGGAPNDAGGCFVDDDCPNGGICICGDAVAPFKGTCHVSNCHVDTDCGSGSLHCASYEEPCTGQTAFACQTDLDQCVSNAACGNDICTAVTRPISDTGETATVRVCARQACNR